MTNGSCDSTLDACTSQRQRGKASHGQLKQASHRRLGVAHDVGGGFVGRRQTTDTATRGCPRHCPGRLTTGRWSVSVPFAQGTVDHHAARRRSAHDGMRGTRGFAVTGGSWQPTVQRRGGPWGEHPDVAATPTTTTSPAIRFLVKMQSGTRPPGPRATRM